MIDPTAMRPVRADEPTGINALVSVIHRSQHLSLWGSIQGFLHALALLVDRLAVHH